MPSDTVFFKVVLAILEHLHIYVNLESAFQFLKKKKKTLFEILIGIHSLYRSILGKLISKEYSNSEQGIPLHLDTLSLFSVILSKLQPWWCYISFVRYMIK